MESGKICRSAALLMLALAAGACGPGDKAVNATDLAAAEIAQPAAEAAVDAAPVVTTTVVVGSIASWIMSSGNLEAIDLVDVLAKVPGQIETLAVEEGDRVEAGDVLLELDPNEYRVAAARTQVEVDKRQADLARYQRMLAEGVLSKVDFAQAEYDLRQAELAAEQAQIDLHEATVRAPIDGVISSRRVHRGARVMGNHHLFTIVNPDELWVHVHVPEADLPGLKLGQAAEVTSDVLDGLSFAATVDRIAPVVDPQSGTVKITVRLADAAQLRPGMFVNVRVVTASRENTLLIPKRAIVYSGEGATVFRVEGTARELVATRVAVSVGAGDADSVEVITGLAAGDRVVVLGQDTLRTGLPVKLVSGEAAGLPSLR